MKNLKIKIFQPATICNYCKNWRNISKQSARSASPDKLDFGLSGRCAL